MKNPNFFMLSCVMVVIIAAQSILLARAAHTEVQKITASDGAADDYFGNADGTSDASRVVIGSIYDNIGANADQGSAYVFVKNGSAWTETQKITASDGAAGDSFGSAVMTLDGAKLFIGATDDDISSSSNRGSVYYFEWNGGAYEERQKIVAPGGAAGHRFGSPLAITSDGSRLVVAAAYANSSKGALYVYTYNAGGNSYDYEATIVNNGAIPTDFYAAINVDISDEGDRIVTGARGDSSDKGAAYVYARSGTTWSLEQKLTANDGVAGDTFGNSAQISGTGDRITIGADIRSSAVGGVYVFDRSGTTWTQGQIITPSDGIASDQFGVMHSMSRNGDCLLITAYRSSTDFRGSAYVFVRNAGTGQYIERQKLVPSDVIAYDFSSGNFVSEDGSIVFMYSSDGTNSYKGAAYAFYDPSLVPAPAPAAEPAAPVSVVSVPIAIAPVISIAPLPLSPSGNGTSIAMSSSTPSPCPIFIPPDATIAPLLSYRGDIVIEIQRLLNTYEGATLLLTGIYDLPTIDAVKRFQGKYAVDILDPWGFERPTGVIYTTTAKKLNELYCRAWGAPPPSPPPSPSSVTLTTPPELIEVEKTPEFPHGWSSVPSQVPQTIIRGYVDLIDNLKLFIQVFEMRVRGEM